MSRYALPGSSHEGSERNERKYDELPNIRVKNRYMKVRKEKFCHRPNMLKKTILNQRTAYEAQAKDRVSGYLTRHEGRDKLCFPNLGVNFRTFLSKLSEPSG